MYIRLRWPLLVSVLTQGFRKSNLGKELSFLHWFPRNKCSKEHTKTATLSGDEQFISSWFRPPAPKGCLPAWDPSVHASFCLCNSWIPPQTLPTWRSPGFPWASQEPQHKWNDHQHFPENTFPDPWAHNTLWKGLHSFKQAYIFLWRKVTLTRRGQQELIFR